MTSLTSWRAACDISARSFGLPTIYERPIVMTNPVDILAVRHVKQGIEAGGSVQDILQITIYFFQTLTLSPSKRPYLTKMNLLAQRGVVARWSSGAVE